MFKLARSCKLYSKKKWKDKLKSSHKENTSDNFHSTNKKLPNFSSKYAYQKIVNPFKKPPTTQKNLGEAFKFS